MSPFATPTAVVRVVRFPAGESADDRLAVEEPLELRVDGEPLAVTLRTPGHDPELAAGFCFTEGIIDDPDDLERVEPCHLADYGNVVNVTLAESARVTRKEAVSMARRELYLSSSCGLCGTQSLDRLERRITRIESSVTVAMSILNRLPTTMAAAQDLFSQTGGLHAAALFTPNGQLRLLREDVGRHNAVDKVIGGLLLSGQLPCDAGVLLVSGRVSFELVQKAARAGIPVLAAVGAPSSLAVAAAERFGLTLVGFLRQGRFNVYAGGNRVRVDL
jgi:FdhD protein